MNSKLLLFLLLPFLNTCESNENSSLIYSHSDGYYKITIASIATKINENGIAQCSKYAQTTVNDTLYSSYGLQLRSVIAASRGTTPKYIGALPFDSLHNKYLDIRIENYTDDKMNYDSLLLSGISNAFNLEISPIDSLVRGYELKVKDGEKLKAHQTECDGAVIQYKGGTWTATSSRLIGIAKILDQYSSSYIHFKVPNQNCYSIEFIVGNDFGKINNTLEPFGLMLEKTDFAQIFYKISTSANNR